MISKLSTYRTQESRKRGVPAYCVFSNNIMNETAISAAKSIEDLRNIKGWGEKMILNYGSDVIQILADPNPEGVIPHGLSIESLTAPEVHNEVEDEVESDITLNAGQEAAVEAVILGKSIVLTGEAGTGKTEVVKYIRNKARKAKLRLALTSTTGTSALLIGGTTIHSYLGIGRGDGSWSNLATFISSKPALKKRWTDLDILVIDEVSMMNPELFDKLDKIGRFIRNNRRVPWGGIKLMLCGDFLQLPVVGSDKFLFEADSFDEVIDEVHILTENVRQEGDQEWSRILSSIRMGELDDEAYSTLLLRVGTDVAIDGVKPTKLYSRNDQVDRENARSILNLLEARPGLETKSYHMTSTSPTGKRYSKEALKKLKDQCIAPEAMELCLGAQVMYLRNNTDMGLSNGSRGVVVGFTEQLPVVKFMNNLTLTVYPEEFTVNNAEHGTSELILKQLPIKVAFAISIHKSQGVTLDCVEVDISKCFCDGQAYVALSRVKTLNGLSLTTKFDRSNISANPKCLEFYKE